MRYLLSILFSLIAYSGFTQGDTILFKLRFDLTDLDGSGKNFPLSFNGSGSQVGMDFSTTYKVEGVSSWVGGDDEDVESNGPYTFNDHSFTISTNFRVYSLYGGYRCIFSNKENSGSYGFDLQLDETNQRIYGRTAKSGSTDDFYTANTVWQYNTWYHLVATVRESGSVTMYLDGVKLELADSVILTDWFTGPDTIAVGGFTGRVQTRELLNGYLDNFHAYDFEVSDAQADSLYDNRANSTYQLGMLGGGAYVYSPSQFQPSYDINGSDAHNKIPYYNNILKEMNYGGVPITLDTMQIYFAENFETLPDMSHATILQYWKPFTSFYWESSQSIVDIDGDHNKVWSSTYHSGREAQADGYELFIPFSDTTNEIWFESAEWADANFNGYSTLCYYSGKIMNGVYGGRTPLYNYPYAVDSSAYGNGWGVDGEWGSASGGCYSGNANQIWPYYGDAEGYYLTLQPFGYTIPRDTWVVWTRRVKINDRGKANGILEWYVNGVLVKQRTDVIWRSVAAHDADQNNVDGILYRFTFGGGDGPYYISPRDNITRHDNLIAYKYNSNAENYLPGPAPIGHTIPIVALPVAGVGNVYPESTFSNETFTVTTGTIQSHYSGVFHVPQAASTADVYTKTIVGHSNPIRLNFYYYHNGYNNSGSDDSYIKIYSGTGPDKTLVWWFQETGEQNGEPVLFSTYTVSNTACTIEYYPGRDFNAGWKLDYW